MGIAPGGAVPFPSSLPPSGPAGGDLAGNYPDPTLAPDAINPLDAIRYAAPLATGTGSSSGDPGNLFAMLEWLSRHPWRRYGQLYLAPGAYTWPDTDGLTPFVPPEGAGQSSWPLEIIDPWVDSGEGTLTVTGYVPPTSTTGAVLTFTGPAWVANQWQGFRARFTGGTGVYATNKNAPLVMANAANTITLPPGEAANRVAVGDTLVLEQPACSLRFQNDFFTQTFLGIGEGTRCMFRGVKLVTGNTVFNQGMHFYCEGTWFQPDGASVIRWEAGGVGGASIFGGFAKPPYTARVGSDPIAAPYTQDITGIYWRGKASAYNPFQWWPVVQLTRSLLVNCEVANAQGVCQVDLLRCVLQGESCTFVDTVGRHNLTSCRFESVSATQMGVGFVCYGNRGAHLFLQNVSFTSCTAGAGLVNGSNNTALTMLTCVGANAGAGVPLTVKNNSSGICAGNTVSGAAVGTDCQVGGNALASTWAAVQTAAGVNDLAAVASQLCRVSSS